MLDWKTHPSPLYSPLGIKYQQAYSGPYKDISTENIVASIKQDEITGFGRPVADNGEATKEEIHHLFGQSTRIWYRDYLQNGLSTISRFLLEKGIQPTFYYTQIIKLLGRSEESLWADVRKSSKSLIHEKQRTYDTVILTGSSHAQKERRKLMTEFKNLHIQICGRQTRSDQTWEINLQQIESGEAVAFFGFKDDTMATANFFIYNLSSAYYGVAKSLPDVNSHWLIWQAIKFFNNPNISMLDMGEQVFQKDHPLYNIAFFKRGFGGITKAFLEFNL